MKAKIIAIVLAVLMVCSIGAFLISMNPNSAPQKITVEETIDFTLATSEYTSSIIVVGQNGEKYLPTYVSGIYYTADLSGKVAFYNYSAGSFVPCTEKVETASVKMTASNQSIPVKISYIVSGGKTIGYGLFTSDMDKSVKLYDYAFVELRNMPEGYGKSYLILCDYDKEDFYKADKTYNEIYEYNLTAASVSTKLSQNTRLVDSNGTYRQDWAMMSDEFIANMGKTNYFMSSRYYTEAETGVRTDIMAYSNAYRPKVVAKDIVEQWFVNNDDGMHYMKTTKDGFKSVVKKGDKPKDVAGFEGDYFTDYLRSGNYIINKHTGEMTNLLTGDKSAFKGVDISAATSFSLSPDAKKAVFAFEGIENANGAPVQKLICANMDADIKTFEEPMLYSESAGFVWLDNDHCMSVRAISEDGAETGSVIYSF